MTSNTDRISGALQENVLVLLCFDDTRCHLVRGTIGSARLFESAVYRRVAEHAIDFIDQFGESIKEHLADHLETELTGDERTASVYKKLLENLYTSRDQVNGEYIVSQLTKFVRQQNLKSAVISAVEALEQGNVDEAEVELQKGLSLQVTTFDTGTSLGDAEQALKFMDSSDEGILTGIAELDSRGLQPRRKELFLVMAPPSRGKSWALVHFGKWALLQRQTVVHVTLEMSEERVAQRYVQSFFGVSKRDSQVKIPVFLKEDSGRMRDVVYETIERITLQDPGIKAKLSSKIQREFRRRPPLIIKQFPTGALTVQGLVAYLDGLERYKKIVPDVLIIDYPDLMQIEASRMREEIGKILKDLRGLAVSRNLAVIGATQSNREGSRARIVDESMVAEDWSKIMIADSIVSYNQTEAEKKLGLARLFAVKSRNDESKWATIISQAYAIGQFSLDSAVLPGDYWDFLGQGDTGPKPD